MFSNNNCRDVVVWMNELKGKIEATCIQRKTKMKLRKNPKTFDKLENVIKVTICFRLSKKIQNKGIYTKTKISKYKN